MEIKSLLPWLSLLAGVARAQVETESINATEIAANTTLVPITIVANATVEEAPPARRVNLNWAALNTSQLVSVALAMNYSTVVLEDLAAVTAVDCSETSVEVTFNSTAEFNNAQTAWSQVPDYLVLITNHMGDCDAEFERGFFLADTNTMVFNEVNLTAVISAEKTNVAATAQETEIDFQNIPVTPADGALAARGITLDQSGLTVAYNYEITESTPIYSTLNNTFNIAISHAQINSTATFSGHLKFSIWEAKLTEMYFDVDQDIYTDLTLDFSLTEKYTYTLDYSPAALSYYLAEVPGIITLGPQLKFSIGAEFSAEGAIDVTTDLSAQIAGANAHVDLINPASSSATNWVPTFTATANVTEKAQVGVTPSMEVTAELAIELFGSLLDLSTGLTAAAEFPVEFTLDATQSATGTIEPGNGTAVASGSVSLPTDGSATCENGVGADIDFDFTLTGFATQWVSVTLYEYNADIWSACYTWF